MTCDEVKLSEWKREVSIMVVIKTAQRGVTYSD